MVSTRKRIDNPTALERFFQHHVVSRWCAPDLVWRGCCVRGLRVLSPRRFISVAGSAENLREHRVQALLRVR
eukprot:2888838-Pleurochrysis_carterae.AAC.1